MTKGQENLLERILKSNAERTDKKFRGGDAEHGDELLKKPPLWILGEALDEATDLQVYLPALKELLEGMNCPHCGGRVF